MSRLLSVLGLLILLPLSNAQAQQQALVAAAQPYLVAEDALLTFRTRAVPGGRLDVDDGVLRAAYRLEGPPPGTDGPEAAARALLPQVSASFGWTREAADLRVAQVRETPVSRHVVFEQTLAGVPVYGRQVKVSLRRDGRATMVLSSYAPGLREEGFDARPRLAAALAEQRARALVTGAAAVSTPTLVVVPSPAPRLGWHLLVWPEAAAAEWSVLLDAHTGALIQVLDQAVRHRGSTHEAPPATWHPPRRAPAASAMPRRRATGTGFVFDPDPLTTANQAYEAPYIDNNDADADALNAERVLVDLPDLTQGSDGLFRLEGPFIQIVGTNNGGTTVYTPPAEVSADAFRYTRADDGFEAVMAYYHADRSQRYIQQLGFFDILNKPFRINPQGLTSDDSFYFPGSKMVGFGTGGVDDAEDASIILHEYAHALIDDLVPGLLNSSEGGAFHEGWADYWAASAMRDLVEDDASKRSDWEVLFKWDSGEGLFWPGRTLNHTGKYPDDIPCASSTLNCDKHNDGRLWGTTMMQVYSALGRTVTDQLNLQGLHYLGSSSTMADAAEALVQADQDLFGGTHTGTLLDILGVRGLVDPSAFGPVVQHGALPSTEQVGGTVDVAVAASSLSGAVDSVLVFFWVDGGFAQRLVLAAESAGQYRGALPLPTTPSTVRYYVEAVDDMGRRTRLPTAAPAQTFAFNTGPDHEAPSITHEPIDVASLAAWPVEVVAQVDDNLGIDTVWVAYTVTNPDGATTAEGTFGLRRGPRDYRATFPVSVSELQKDSGVSYRVFARDVAQAANERVIPAEGSYAFSIVASGILRAYTFEGVGDGLTATGTWERGTPTYGLRMAHSGRNVWGTALNAAYPEAGGQVSLSLPPLNLDGVSEAYLVFWHWYDTEHDGTAEPGRQDGFVWDGGNVKVSTDGGATWTVAVPEGGYSGTIIDTQANPMRGQQAFGGFSYGWRQEIIPLTAAQDVHIRFDFGSDDSNTEVRAFEFAGWFLDDISITTVRPEDLGPPTLAGLPEATTLQAVGSPLPPLVVSVSDDIGVADVWVDYEINTRQGRSTGTTRLAMSVTDLRRFVNPMVAWQGLSSGSQIDYRFRVRDFAGNEAMMPSAAAAPLRIEYRVIASTNLLQAVVPSGAWAPAGNGWRADEVGTATWSSLVFEPFDLPANATETRFILDHRYVLGPGLGGNVKVSTDDGKTWAVLGRAEDYNTIYAPDTLHPMAGEPVYRGFLREVRHSVFDLGGYAGQQVRLRIDLATPQAFKPGESWTIARALIDRSTTADAFETPRTLTLHANFPDPFSHTTTLGYTLPDAVEVRLEVYDILGRRVAVLVDAMQQAGTYSLPFDGSALAGGVYLLRLQAGAVQKVERMVVAR